MEALYEQKFAGYNIFDPDYAHWLHQHHSEALVKYLASPVVSRGVARILGKGVLKYVRRAHAQKFKLRPLINCQGRSSNCQRECVLNVASELAQGFQSNLGIR